jgi:phage replication-related protein YjqB (UPF0714/DUF867 family)
MFAELLAHPDVDEVCELRSSFGFMAYHGGGLEVMTDVIAQAAAERSGASYYGVHQPTGMDRHIPSIEVGPEASPLLADFLDHVDVVITVHGYGRAGLFTSLLLGGQNRDLAAVLAAQLRSNLPAYSIVDDLDDIPVELRGIHPRNPVNLPRLQGVQLELPPRVRGSSPLWWDWEGPELTPHTASLVDALAVAATIWPT